MVKVSYWVDIEHVNELGGEYRYKLSVGNVWYESSVLVKKWGSTDNGIRVIVLHVQVEDWVVYV